MPSKSEIVFSILPLALGTGLFITYGTQFIVFRGNNWDWFNYLTMTMAFAKYTPHELLYEAREVTNHLVPVAALNYYQRPTIAILNAVLFEFSGPDIFLHSFFFKLFLCSLSMKVTFDFFEKFYAPGVATILTMGFSLGFGSFFVFEIDALAQLSVLAMPWWIFLWDYDRRRSLTDTGDEVNSLASILLPAVIFAGFASLYIEGASIFIAIVVIMSLAREVKSNGSFNVVAVRLIKQLTLFTKGRMTVFSVALLLLLPLFDQTIRFWFEQFNKGISASVDWWGYFGAFLLGVQSPVTDIGYVEATRAMLARQDAAEIFLWAQNLLKGHAFEILPSLLGLFHLTSIHPVISAALSGVALIVLFDLATKLFLPKVRHSSPHRHFLPFLSYGLGVFGLLTVFLAAQMQFWSALKAYVYAYPLLYALFAFPLSTKNIEKALRISVAVMLCMLPIYKYGEFNHGIGRYDSFPSIIDPELKMNEDWNPLVAELEKCTAVELSVLSPFKHHFWVLILEGQEIPYLSLRPIQQSYGFGAIVGRMVAEGHQNFDCFIGNDGLVYNAVS